MPFLSANHNIIALKDLVFMSSYTFSPSLFLYTLPYCLFSVSQVIFQFHILVFFQHINSFLHNRMTSYHVMMCVDIYLNLVDMFCQISRDDKLNPIRQDSKNGKIRFVDNCFPHHGYIWNYGAFPQVKKSVFDSIPFCEL